MKNLLRSLLLSILVFSLPSPGQTQQPLKLDQVQNLADQPNAILYGITGVDVEDPHPSNIRFRPLSTFERPLKLNNDQALWRKLSIKTTDLTDFVIDFEENDYAAVYLFQDGQLLKHLQTGYLRANEERQISSDNIAHLQLEANQSYDLFIRTRGVFNRPTESLKITTLAEWISHQQLTGIVNIGFVLFVLAALIYTAVNYARKRLRAYLCFGVLLISTLTFFAYVSGVLRELVFLSNPTGIRFFMCALLATPFCYYRMLEQVMQVEDQNFDAKDILKWTAYANLFLMVICTLALIDVRHFVWVEQVVRYSLIVDSALCAVAIYTLWKSRDGHRLYFMISSVIMLLSLFVGTLLWQNDSVVTSLIVLSTVLHVPFSAYALGIVVQFTRLESPDTFVEELKENQQMIERQKQDLALQIDELSQKLGGAMQEVEHSAKVKEDFLSIMSHEIRTPLNAIVGLTHLISKEDDIDEIKTNIGTLERSVDALLGLIDDVLDFNKIYTGQLQLDSIDFDLHETVKRIAKTYKLSADQKKIDFEFNFDPLIPINVGGDAFRLTQVLDNLLSNAIKFTNEGTISFSASYLNGHQSDRVRVKFEIEDSGIGIAPDDLSKIFDRFQQADTDISRKYGESGLGLSIAKALISMMGRDFNVKSQPGQGSVFSFILEFDRSGPEDKTTRRMEQIEEGMPQGLRILVVDDNEMNRMILNQFLSKWGVEADDAANGKEAFEKIVKNSYDLVLLDLQMPIMDGYELTKLIRSNEMLRDLPIIAISADSISNVYEKVTAAGMNDFIVKPLNPSDLKQKIAVYSHNLQMHGIYSR